MTVYVNFHFHLNMFYAEYTDEEVIRRFPNIYRALLDFFDRFPRIKAGWDIEATRSINYLKRVAPDVIDRINKGIEKGQFEILLDTWSFSLPAMHTGEEFDFQHRLAVKNLTKTFKRVSKGYFAQECSYHPAMPILFRRNGVDYFVIQMSAVRNLLQDVSNLDHRMHELIAYDGATTIPCVLFVTGVVEDPVAKIKQMKDSEFGDVLVVIMEDAEVLRTDVLEDYISEFDKLGYVEYVLCSDFVRSAKVGKSLALHDLTWVPGPYDYLLWVRDPWDQYLWTLNENVRQDIREAEFWIKKAKGEGVDVIEEEGELDEAKKWMLLGQNSDKLGWAPCTYKRFQGEYEYRYASEIAQIAGAVASEKIFSRMSFDWAKEPFKKYLIFNYHPYQVPEMPLNLGIRLEDRVLKMEEVVLQIGEENVLSDFTSSKLHFDGTLNEANLVYIGGLKPGEIVTAQIVKGELEMESREAFSVSENVLGNELLELQFKKGVPLRLVDKSNDTIYGGEDQPFLDSLTSFLDEENLETSPSVEVSNRGDRGVFAEVRYNRMLTNSSSISTRFRVYRGLPLLEVESQVDVRGAHAGRIEPLNLRPSIGRPRMLWRELGSHLVPLEVRDNRIFHPLVNDWFALSNDEKGLIVAGDGKIRSFKEIRDGETEISLFKAESTYSTDPMEAFRGVYQLKCIIVPFKGRLPDKYVSLARCYTMSPGIVGMTQYEGFRQVV
ncbi:MAG: hypothetical protein ACUVXA_04030 [Candidatus Jordarchaeum sp.]|uniref:hypothetical protein n=1 Tax=Candidatus Jordarchaeum sp. TaxID=2823881 RepID=UPI00404B1040